MTKGRKYMYLTTHPLAHCSLVFLFFSFCVFVCFFLLGNETRARGGMFDDHGDEKNYRWVAGEGL